MTLRFSVDAGFWAGRRVFVTGHTGFKGSWLTYWLAMLGAKVYGYALPPAYEGGPFTALGIADLCSSTLADLRDRGALVSALHEARPEVVLHLAGQAIVRRSFADPLATLETNVMGTANLLDVCRSIDTVRSIVVITSDKCYLNTGSLEPYRESDRLGGHDMYSASKASAELVVEAYRESFFRAEGSPVVATARAGNVFGGGDWSDQRLIPDAIRAFTNNEALLLRNPMALRPWQFVLDALSGYLSLARACYESGREYEGAWNFGPDYRDVRTAQDVVSLLAEHWPSEATWTSSSNEWRFPEDPILLIDPAKARERLGWNVGLDLDEALGLTAVWYHEQSTGADTEAMRALTARQIERYANA